MIQIRQLDKVPRELRYTDYAIYDSASDFDYLDNVSETIVAIEANGTILAVVGVSSPNSLIDLPYLWLIITKDGSTAKYVRTIRKHLHAYFEGKVKPQTMVEVTNKSARRFAEFMGFKPFSNTFELNNRLFKLYRIK